MRRIKFSDKIEENEVEEEEEEEEKRLIGKTKTKSEVGMAKGEAGAG